MKFFVFVVFTFCFLSLALSHLFADSKVQTTSLSQPSAREIHEEADPDNEQACFSMGHIAIAYSSESAGLPKVGLRIIDPRGREIGYDPGTKRVWQGIPLAQAYLDCDENEDTGELRNCKGRIEICGPISGTYRVQVLSTQNTKFSISASATSSRTRRSSGYGVTTSRAHLEDEILKHEPAVLLLRYSREAGTSIQLNGSDKLAGK